MGFGLELVAWAFFKSEGLRRTILSTNGENMMHFTTTRAPQKNQEHLMYCGPHMLYLGLIILQ